MKVFLRAVFSIYNYVIYKLSTRYIYASIDSLLSRNILPGPVLLSFFLVGYIGIYLAIISIYWLLISFLFSIQLAPYQIMAIIFGSALILMGINLHGDIANFRNFLLEMENIFKSLREGGKSDAKKAS